MRNPNNKNIKETESTVTIIRTSGWNAQFEANFLKYPTTVLSMCDKMVYIVLNAHANKTDSHCYPTLNLIADEASCSRRTVQNSLLRLQEKGFINVIHRVSERHGGKIANLYEILPMPLTANKNLPGNARSKQTANDMPSTTCQEVFKTETGSVIPFEPGKDFYVPSTIACDSSLPSPMQLNLPFSDNGADKLLQTANNAHNVNKYVDNPVNNIVDMSGNTPHAQDMHEGGYGTTCTSHAHHMNERYSTTCATHMHHMHDPSNILFNIPNVTFPTEHSQENTPLPPKGEAPYGAVCADGTMPLESGEQSVKSQTPDSESKSDTQDVSSPTDNPEKKRSGKKNIPSSYPQEFEDFWKAYPRQEKKGRAYKAWSGFNMTAKDKQDLILATQSYSVAMQGREIRYIPHPATYLNGMDWLDYVQGSQITPMGTQVQGKLYVPQQSTGQKKEKRTWEDRIAELKARGINTNRLEERAATWSDYKPQGNYIDAEFTQL